MILVRDVFQARYGKGDELVVLLKESQKQWREPYSHRILTDASGTFFTVVAETQVPSLAEWEKFMADTLSRADFADWFHRMTPLVESGRREFFRIEK